MQIQSSKFAPIVAYDRTNASERAILKLMQSKGLWLRYSEIIRLVTPRWSRRTVARYLNGMEKRGLIEKRVAKKGNQSSYRVLDAPKEYDTLEYVNDLRERAQERQMVYDWEVGGFISSLAEGMLLGFPEVDQGATPIEKEIISTFLVRIAYSFSALLSMRNVMLWRKLGADVPIDDHVIRQYILELQARKMNDTKLETGQLLNLASDSLCSTKKIISRLIKENEKSIPAKRPRLNDFDLLELGNNAFEKVLEGKKQLRHDGLDIDRLTIGALHRKWERVQRKIEMHHSKQIMKNQNKKPFIKLTAPSYYAKRDNLLTRGLNLKLAEEMNRAGLIELNDFGMVVTSNRRAMNKYFDNERMVYDATIATERFNRTLKVGSKEFAADVGETMAAYNHMTEDSLRALSHKPWFQRYFGDNLDFMLQAFRKQKDELRARHEKERDVLFSFENMPNAGRH